MKKIYYNFSKLENSVSNFIILRDKNSLEKLRRELNSFFKDSFCKDILYTNNTDKLFFGMCVTTIFDDNTAVFNILSDTDINPNTQYILEVDSKLLDLGLSTKEFVAILLHEIGHVVNNTQGVDAVKNYLNIYLAKNRESIDVQKVARCLPIFKYAISNSITKLTSLFYKDYEEVIADEFVIACGYGQYLESGMKIIISSIGTLNKTANVNKLIALQWALRIYKDFSIRRVNVLQTLRNIEPSLATQTDKKHVKSIINTVSNPIHESFDTRNFFKERERKHIRKSIKNFENDYYDILLRAKNTQDYNESLTLLRKVNSTISLIEDFISSDKIDNKDKWFDIIDKFKELRELLSNKEVYKDKYYGLFVQTPVIKSRYEI